MEFVDKEETVATSTDKNVLEGSDIPSEVYIDVTINERVDAESRDVAADSLSASEIRSETDQPVRRSYYRKSGMALYQASVAQVENREDC